MGVAGVGKWRRRLAVYWLAAGLALAGWWLPGLARAQHTGEDLLRNAACRADPDSELCICRDQFVYRMVPANVDYSTFPPTARHRVDGDANPVDKFDFSGETYAEPLGLGVVYRSTSTGINPPPPEWNQDLQRWEGDLVDMTVMPNRKFDAYCSLSYLQENLRRLVFIVIAIGSVLFSVSLGWAGFVHMQETATGGNRAVARTVILRAMVGMILLAAIFVVWQGISAVFLEGMNIWDLDPRLFEAF